MSEATDIAALMVKDPLKHTDQDIDLIIKKMREQRHAFNTVTPKAPAGKKADKPVIDLGSLDLD